LRDQFVLIGHPLGHSVSPAIHRAAYEVLEKEGQYELLDCPTSEDVQRAIDKIRNGELTGANVTVPWKLRAYQLSDEQSDSARRVGVANVLCFSEGRVVAHNTDATALADELSNLCADSEADAAERPGALVIGNGGAARAAVVACQLAGFVDVGVTARRFAPETNSVQWAHGAEFTKLGARLLSWPGSDPEPCSAFLEKCQLIVQATSAGMKGTAGGEEVANCIPWPSMQNGAAYDLVYNPTTTPFLARAVREGHVAAGGLGMLVGQAADAIEIWWGRRPAQQPLFQAARKALSL
jgi:shikimate dehydrogenase